MGRPEMTTLGRLMEFCEALRRTFVGQVTAAEILARACILISESPNDLYTSLSALLGSPVEHCSTKTLGKLLASCVGIKCIGVDMVLTRRLCRTNTWCYGTAPAPSAGLAHPPTAALMSLRHCKLQPRRQKAIKTRLERVLMGSVI